MKALLVKIKSEKICWQVDIVFVYSVNLSVVSSTFKTKNLLLARIISEQNIF